LHR
jgi:hypothetical protein